MAQTFLLHTFTSSNETLKSSYKYSQVGRLLGKPAIMLREVWSYLNSHFGGCEAVLSSTERCS